MKSPLDPGSPSGEPGSSGERSAEWRSFFYLWGFTCFVVPGKCKIGDEYLANALWVPRSKTKNRHLGFWEVVRSSGRTKNRCKAQVKNCLIFMVLQE
jgi:hypothetical protein